MFGCLRQMQEKGCRLLDHIPQHDAGIATGMLTTSRLKSSLLIWMRY